MSYADSKLLSNRHENKIPTPHSRRDTGTRPSPIDSAGKYRHSLDKTIILEGWREDPLHSPVRQVTGSLSEYAPERSTTFTLFARHSRVPLTWLENTDTRWSFVCPAKSIESALHFLKGLDYSNFSMLIPTWYPTGFR